MATIPEAFAIAIQHQQGGRLQAAEQIYRQILSAEPNHPDALHLLGVIASQVGQHEVAVDYIRRAIRLHGNEAVFHSNRLLSHLGLAQVLDARGQYAEAARHLARGNALQLSERRKGGQEYDPNEHELFVSRMIAICAPEFFERVRCFGLESELPVFVVGLPRSGTTLIEQILAGHSRVFGAGEVPLACDTMAALCGRDATSLEGLRRLDCETARRLAARHLERLRALSGKATRIVDKRPENYLFLGLLASLFPRAKLIHCRRDLRDVAVSCWMTHFTDIRWANDERHIASRFHEYQRIMEHWRQVLPVPLLEVDYEETVVDLEGVARKIVGWCGLEWEPGCLEFHRGKRTVRTASAVQVRQPLYATSMGRWRHYEQSLATLLGAIPADTRPLAPMMGESITGGIMNASAPA